MLLFIVRGTTIPGKVEEFAATWKDSYGPRFQEMPEFVRAYFSADRATDTWTALAVWSARPDDAMLRNAIQEFGGRIAHLMAGPPTVEWQEALQQI